MFDPTLNSFGARIVKSVNRFANELNSFVYYKQNFQGRSAFSKSLQYRLNKLSYPFMALKILQDGKDVYPGEKWCQPQQAHAKWHAQASVGLLDLAYLADEINRLTA